jgi:hypothetical protein
MARRVETRNESILTRIVDSVFAFVRQAEFEILFFLFFFIAYILFKDIVSSYMLLPFSDFSPPIYTLCSNFCSFLYGHHVCYFMFLVMFVKLG